MTEPVYSYEAEGREPERLVIDVRNGRVRFVMRGEPNIVWTDHPERGFREEATAGPTAVMTLPLSAVAELVQKLVTLPPVAGMLQAVPFVMWFPTTAARDAWVAELREDGSDEVDVT